MVQNGGLVLHGGTKFSNPIKEMSKEKLNACVTCLYTSARKKDGTYCKSSLIKSIGAVIDRFLRSPPSKKEMYEKIAFSKVENLIKQLFRSPFCGYEIINIYFGIIVSQSCFDQFP